MTDMNSEDHLGVQGVIPQGYYLLLVPLLVYLIYRVR